MSQTTARATGRALPDTHRVNTIVASRLEAEWRIAVCYKQEGVGLDSHLPAEDADHKVKHVPRIPTRKKYGEPSQKHHDYCGYPQYEKDNVVWNCQEPLNERQPSVQILAGVRIDEIDMDGLLLIGGGVWACDSLCSFFSHLGQNVS